MLRFHLNLCRWQLAFVSSLLLISSVTCQRQYFRVKPQPNVEVVEGGSVLLFCEIGAQAGQVQWSKNGFLLGYDRSIPGLSRYSMTGNPSQGIHNLRIEGARLEDDGEYQCQVGPGPVTQPNEPIRANTKLTVLLRPTSIDIVGHANGSKVEIMREESLRLECVVSGGKPAAQIKWFRRNFELRSDHVETQTTEMSAGGGNDADSLVTELTVSRSAISLRPNPDDNNVPYTCEAHHPALDVPMRHTVVLSVIYPPGPPEISGHQEGPVRMGDTLTLVCRSRGGNPLAQLIWFKNNEQVDFSYTTTRGVDSANSHTFIVDASDNNAVYRCEAYSLPISPTPMIASVKLQVHFPPSQVVISGVREAKAGDNVTMVCTTTRSNPPAEISWVVDGRAVVVESSVTPDASGGFVTTANVTVSITNQDRNMKTFNCYAMNKALGDSVAETAVLNILYPPDPPYILGYVEGTSIRAGSLQRMTCTAHGGNPLPELKWFKGSEEIKSSFLMPSTSGNVVSNELALVTKDSDNGAEYRCEASSAATGDTPLMASIRLTVHFPASGVQIKIVPKGPKAGSRVELNCESTGSNPVSEITWWRNGFMIQGTPDGVFDAPYGGKAARNVLALNVSSEDDGAVYTCQATNKALSQSVHDASTLTVLYPPSEVVISGVREARAGDSVTMTCTTTKSNPAAEISWIVDGRPIVVESLVTPDGSGGFITSANVTVSISKQDRNMKTFNCTALSKALGDLVTETTVLNILYPPDPPAILGYVEGTAIRAGSLQRMTCVANGGNPRPELKWFKDGLEITQLNSSLTSSGSGSVVSNELALVANDTDNGAEYRCEATSAATGDSPLVVSIALNVHYKPIIDRSPILSKSAVESGEAGRLVCRARGSPNVTFTWTREGSVILAKRGITGDNVVIDLDIGAETAKYLEETEQVDSVTFQSVLLIQRASSSDYGEYKCMARNLLGVDTIPVNFTRTSKPDTPLALHVINVTANEVTLRWIPGFDGGLQQSFQIRFKRTGHGDKEAYLYSDVYPSNMTQYTLDQLAPETEYSFSLMAYNGLGQSEYTSDIVKAATGKESPAAETKRVFSQVLSGKAGDIPRLIIICVSVVGSSLLLLNLVLVICFVRKRRKKRLEEAACSDESSTSKSGAAVEMYGPSSGSGCSYNNGVIVETSLSGTSDEDNKSEHAWSANSGQTEYAIEIPPPGVVAAYPHHYGISTYLIDDSLSNVPNYFMTRSPNEQQQQQLYKIDGTIV